MNKISYMGILIFIFISVHIFARPVKIVTSTSIFADMIKNVGQSLVEVQTIVPTGNDPHAYEPTPSDVKLISGADLVMINGLNLELWIHRVIKNIRFPNKRVIILTEGIKPLSSQDYTNSKDPHAWMTIQNGLVYIRNIYQQLDPYIEEKDKKILKINYLNYKRKLEATENFILQKISLIPPAKRKLVTAHDAFQYFGKAYNIDLYPLQGVSPESEILIQDFQNIIKTIKKHQITAIFIESTINKNKISIARVFYTNFCISNNPYELII